MIRNFVGLLFSWRQPKKWYNRIAQFTFYRKKSDMVNVPSDGGITRSLAPFPINAYFPAIKSKFDDIEILIPRDAEQYLLHNYGEWKDVPPIEKRWQHFIEKIEL